MKPVTTSIGAEPATNFNPAQGPVEPGASSFETLLSKSSLGPVVPREPAKRPARLGAGLEELLLAQRSVAATALRVDQPIDTPTRTLKPTAAPLLKVKDAPSPRSLDALAARAGVTEVMAARAKAQQVADPQHRGEAHAATKATHHAHRAQRAVEERPPEQRAEERTTDAPALAPASLPGAPLAPTSDRPFALEAPPPTAPAPLAALPPALFEDPSLRVVLMPQVARLSVDTADAGRLHLQIKLADGVAELRATGPAASLMEARQGELRVALAKEGLAMGSFDLTQSDSRGQADRPQPDEDLPRRPPTAARTTISTAAPIGDGHLHVKA